MSILFGWNSYLLKSIAPIELGLSANDLPNTRIEYRQRYFHLFFIPLFPIGRIWTVRKEGKLYEPSEQLELALAQVQLGRLPGVWAWSGILLGLAAWIFISISNRIEENRYQKYTKNNKEALVAFFQDKNKTTPLSIKLNAMNNLIDSTLSTINYEDKVIDTSLSALLVLYADAKLTQYDSLTGYNEKNTFVVSEFPHSKEREPVINESIRNSVMAGEWKGYFSDTSSVFSEVRKLNQFNSILVLKEYNRIEPQALEDGYTSGYSFVIAILVDIETGKMLKKFRVMSSNSEKVTQFSIQGASASSLVSTLNRDLKMNVLKDAQNYVFGQGLH